MRYIIPLGIIVQIILFLAIPSLIAWAILAIILLIVFSGTAAEEGGYGESVIAFALSALAQGIPVALLIFAAWNGVTHRYPAFANPVTEERLVLQRVQPIVSLSTTSSVNGVPFGYIWTGINYQVMRQTEDGGYQMILVDGETTRIYETAPNPEAAQIRYYIRQQRIKYRSPVPGWVFYIFKRDEGTAWHQAPESPNLQKMLVPRGSIRRELRT